MSFALRLAAVALPALLGLTACGSDDPGNSLDTATTLSGESSDETRPVEESGEGDGGDAAGTSERPIRPQPDQSGEFGTFTFSGIEFQATARSCRQTYQDVPDTMQTVEVVDGQTNNTLHVALTTQNGASFGVEVYNFSAGSGDAPLAVGNAEAEDGDAERTNGEGTFEDGDSFTFSFVLVGSADC